MNALTEQYAATIELHRLLQRHCELYLRKQHLPELKTAFVDSLPNLYAIRQQFVTLPQEPEVYLDTLLQSEDNGRETRLTGVESLVTYGYNYYIGQRRTYLLAIRNAQEKLVHLEELAQKKEQGKAELIKQYTCASFDRQLETIFKQDLALALVDKEYRTRLKKYLLTFKDQFIAEAKGQVNINYCLHQQLLQKVTDFAKKHFADYEHLDKIKNALKQFKVYAVETKSIFEDIITKGEKQTCLVRLMDITEDEQLSAAERIRKIKELVLPEENPRYKAILTGRREFGYFSATAWLYFFVCILQQFYIALLLEKMGIYLNPARSHFKQLEAVINKEPPVSSLMRTHGFFVTKPPSAITYGPEPLLAI